MADALEIAAARMTRLLAKPPRSAKTRAYLNALPKREKIVVTPADYAQAVRDAERYADWERRGKPPSPSQPRKDRLRARTGFKPMENDLAEPYMPTIIAKARLKAGVTATHFAIWDQCGGRCHYCGEPMARTENEPRSFTLDHVIPRARGGTHSRDNLVGSCLECNGDKGRLTGEEYEAVLAVRRGKREAA